MITETEAFELLDKYVPNLMGLRKHLIGVSEVAFEIATKIKQKNPNLDLNPIKYCISLRVSNPELKLVGFSGLCVTSQGIGLFYNKFNCRERDFINSEHILDKNGEILILDSNSNKEIGKKISEGYNYKNRCKMLITYPNEISLVWNYF